LFEETFSLHGYPYGEIHPYGIYPMFPELASGLMAASARIPAMVFLKAVFRRSHRLLLT
jgi:hypothetical protein